MTITTLDGVIAGMQPPRMIMKAVTPTLVAGKPQSLWALGGMPGAGAYDTTLNGVALSSTSAMVNGQIPHTNPVSGNAHLARFSGSATIAGNLLLLDRLWHNGGYTITSTGAQNSTTPTWPSRDVNATADGEGVLLALEISAAAGAAAPTITVSYTNQSGTSGRSATNINPTANSPAAGSMFLIGLQAGDRGVRSVQSLTLSASWLSGTMNLVAYRLIAALELPTALSPNAIDAISSGMPRLYDGAVPYLAFIPATTTASNISGNYVETQG